MMGTKMQPRQTIRRNRAPREGGQTLIIAVIILGILLILGVAFASIINRNITDTRESGRRTLSGDAARAGAEYAHTQMLNSPLKADWRPDPTPLAGGDFSRDPDALYLRAGSGLTVEPDPINRPGFTLRDLGGPDYLGPYTRVNLSNSRALVRVRFDPGAYATMVSPTGALRAPGLARSMVVVESIGREGVVDPNDPTDLLVDAVRVQNYADGADLRGWVGRLKDADKVNAETKKVLAVANLPTFASRFVMNVDNVSRPVEWGAPVSTGGVTWFENLNLGVLNEGAEVIIPTALGNPNAGPVLRSSQPWDTMPGLGSIHVNGKLRFFGRHNVALNRFFGESISATDGFEPGNGDSELNLLVSDYTPGTDSWAASGLVTLDETQYDSTNPLFTTASGVLKDGEPSSDANGFQREVPVIDAPLITSEDPATGLNPYREASQNTGVLNSQGVNVGRFGYGEGIYVDAAEKGNQVSDASRNQADPSTSLPNDWLNPNNGNTRGWQGPYYVPIASYLQLLPDGFVITRDARSRQRSWRDPVSGADLGQASMRFYIRLISVAGRPVPFVLSQASANALGVNPATATNAQFQSAAARFNGVVMFEGDVRVRGVVPTDVQVNVVSMGSIYIEGSIVKGVNAGLDGTSPGPAILSRPSKSMIALMARDYVVLNTTQFFGPVPGQNPQPKSGDALPDTPNPVELDLTNPNLALQAQFLLDRTGTNPQAWVPLAGTYTMPAGLSTTSSQNLNVNLMIQASADDNGPAYIDAEIDARAAFDPNVYVGPMLFPTYQGFGFPGSLTYQAFNAAEPFYTPAAPVESTLVPTYGLGDPVINAYPKFETVAMPVIGGNYTSTWNAVRRVIENRYQGTLINRLATEDPTVMTLQWNGGLNAASKNFLAARTALAPFDIRIEAVLYAERGSFFVIPGPWFNANPDDTREAFEASYTAAGGDDLDRNRLDYGAGANLTAAQQRRFERFGNSPHVPFYAEPLDVKITVLGSVIENMPAPLSQQVEWMKKWGWIPRRLGGTGLTIPRQHSAGYDLNSDLAVPNLQVVYDPALATGSVPVGPAFDPIRVDDFGRTLPPVPRLPVSPKLAYFGEATP